MGRTDWTDTEHHVDALEVEFLKADGGQGAGEKWLVKLSKDTRPGLSVSCVGPALYIDSQLASFSVKVNLNQVRILEKRQLTQRLPLLGRESEQGRLRTD